MIASLTGSTGDVISTRRDISASTESDEMCTLAASRTDRAQLSTPVFVVEVVGVPRSGLA